MTGPRVRYEIEAGPSREELFDALRLRHEGRKVSFTVRNMIESGPGSEKFIKASKLVFHVQVNKLSIEDGSGNNWIFELYDQQGLLEQAQCLEGYINTTHREGWIKPIK